MAIFIGTNADEVVLPGVISPTVGVFGPDDLSEADRIFMDGGNDIVQGDEGNDLAVLGAGDDRFIWNPGDDNDTIEGQDGTDTMQFNGANADETVVISPKAGAEERSFFVRDVVNVPVPPATVLMDMDRVERIEFNALGGVDLIDVNDLTGTDVNLVDLDLSAAIGSGVGDTLVDRVNVDGTDGRDLISVRTLGGSTVVGGLAARVEIAGEDAGQDILRIDAGAGNDRISAARLTDDGMKFEAFGGAGNDLIRGGEGDDLLSGGRGHDQIFGALGDDELTGNSGRDLFIFAGQNGRDTITDFRNGVDKIDIRGYGAALNSFADLAGDISQVGADVRINLGAIVAGAGRITIENFNVAQLNAADFDF
jgi:Ca2+-binding RTX toxin-like protein